MKENVSEGRASSWTLSHTRLFATWPTQQHWTWSSCSQHWTAEDCMHSKEPCRQSDLSCLRRRDDQNTASIQGSISKVLPRLLGALPCLPIRVLDPPAPSTCVTKTSPATLRAVLNCFVSVPLLQAVYTLAPRQVTLFVIPGASPPARVHAPANCRLSLCVTLLPSAAQRQN